MQSFDVITVFPEFFTSILAHGPTRRVIESGALRVRLRNLRDFADDNYRSVDDRPFGGGPGMVFKPEPIFRAVDSIRAEAQEARFRIVLLSPQGSAFDQGRAEEFSQEDHLILISGRYEGVDERVTEYLATDEISIGDYVLSGGELAAAVILDSVARLLPGAMGNEESKEMESFTAAPGKMLPGADRGGRLLDFPQYTRPADFRGLKVPDVLLSGNHQEIREWRRRRALLKTCRNRPDLLEKAGLTPEQVCAEVEQAS